MFRVFDYLTGYTEKKEKVRQTTLNAQNSLYQAKDTVVAKAIEVKKTATDYWYGKPEDAINQIKIKQEERKRQLLSDEEQKKLEEANRQLEGHKIKIRRLIGDLNDEVESLEDYLFFRRGEKIRDKQTKIDALGELIKIKDLVLFIKAVEKNCEDPIVVKGRYSRTRDVLEAILKNPQVLEIRKGF